MLNVQGYVRWFGVARAGVLSLRGSRCIALLYSTKLSQQKLTRTAKLRADFPHGQFDRLSHQRRDDFYEPYIFIPKLYLRYG